MTAHAVGGRFQHGRARDDWRHVGRWLKLESLSGRPRGP